MQWSRVCFERTQCVSGNICRPNTTCFFFLQRWNANIWAEKVEMKVDGDGRSNIQTEQHKQRTEGWLWLRFTFAPWHWARYCLFVFRNWFQCLSVSVFGWHTWIWMLQFFVIDFPLVFGEERAGRADISRKVGGWGLSWPLSHQPLSPRSLQSNPHFKHSFYILHIDLD